MTEPVRIQLRRSKGWRKPEGAIVVSRPSKWGNPIRVTPIVDWNGARMFQVTGSPISLNGGPAFNDPETARWFAVRYFDWDLRNDRFGAGYPSIDEIVAELAGHDLACWCPIRYHRNGRIRWGECHADVLLEIANVNL